LEALLRRSEVPAVRFGPNRISRTFQARVPELVMVGVSEICGFDEDGCFESFAKALFGLLMSTFPRAVPTARMLTVLHNLK
jgi:hypothetical protein